MKRKIILSVALLACCTMAFAWYAGIDGKWSAMLKGPDGNEFPLTYSFKTEGTTLTGTLTSAIGTSTISGGTMKGDSIWFTANVGKMQIKNKGKYYANGDSISLRVGNLSTHTTLKRVVDK